MCKTYIPTNQLFDAFIKRVLHYEISSYSISKNWKKERLTDDRYVLTHSNGNVETFEVLHSWNVRMKQTSRFPLCAVKHTTSHREGTWFYTFTGFEDSWDLVQLVVNRVKFIPSQPLENWVFLQKARNIYPAITKTEEREWEEVQRCFKECFTEDPATRLWAVTGNLF